MPPGTTEAATLEAISDNVIEVENPTKYYSDLVTVDHISFVVHRDEVFGFLSWDQMGPARQPSSGC